jgi:hypothetical protein
VSERGLPIADGAPACPFVAFEDDRDERAAVPDHRHRCYAEVRPAPRALAHQEAYCLSSAFPVCPTFQDWARREAARARDAAAAGVPRQAEEPVAASIEASGTAGEVEDDAAEVADEAAAAFAPVDPEPALSSDDPEEHEGAADPDEPDHHDDEPPRRNPRRDWSAPPPWLASAEAARAAPLETPDFLAGRSDPARGLAGSAADLLAGGSPPRPHTPMRQPPAPPPADIAPRHRDEVDFEERDLPRPATPPRRPRAYDQHLGGPSTGPDWERPRRYEAYPTIKTRMALPPIPRLAAMGIALALAAVALFFLPALLGLGSDDPPGGGASATPTAAPSRSIAPTPTPAPTPIFYLIKSGDTLSKIAVEHGLTIDQLLAANPEITDPNKITVGQQIVIPAPSPEIPDEFGGSAAPSAAASAAP